MTWPHLITAEGPTVVQKTLLALGAFAVAGLAVFKVQSALQQWRKTHLDFTFPTEEDLFIGWGGNTPGRVPQVD